MRLPVSKSMTYKCDELKIDTYNNNKGKMLSYKNPCLTNISWSSEPMSTAGRGDMHLKFQHLWGRVTWIPGPCWSVRLAKPMSSGCSETLAQTWVWLQDVEKSISNRKHHPCSWVSVSEAAVQAAGEWNASIHPLLVGACRDPNCQAKCAHCCNTDNIIMKLTKCFLINFEPHSTGGHSCLVQEIWSKAHEHEGDRH